LNLLHPVRHGLGRRQAAVGNVARNQRLETVVQHLWTEVDVVLLGGDHRQVVILHVETHDRPHKTPHLQTDLEYSSPDLDSSPELSPFLLDLDLDLDLGSKDSDLDLDLKAMDSDLEVLSASPFFKSFVPTKIAL